MLEPHQSSMSALSMGHLVGECSGPCVKNGRSLTGQHHEVLFCPITPCQNSVMPKLSESPLWVLKWGRDVASSLHAVHVAG